MAGPKQRYEVVFGEGPFGIGFKQFKSASLAYTLRVTEVKAGGSASDLGVGVGDVILRIGDTWIGADMKGGGGELKTVEPDKKKVNKPYVISLVLLYKLSV